MRTTIPLIIFCFLFSGCAKVAHLQQLLTLQKFSQNKDAQNEYVTMQDANYEKVLGAVEDGTVKDFSDKETFRENFGEPIFLKEITRGGQRAEEWMYRYSMQITSAEKVYVYFDQDDQLIEWRRVDAKPNNP